MVLDELKENKWSAIVTTSYQRDLQEEKIRNKRGGAQVSNLLNFSFGVSSSITKEVRIEMRSKRQIIKQARMSRNKWKKL